MAEVFQLHHMRVTAATLMALPDGQLAKVRTLKLPADGEYPSVVDLDKFAQAMGMDGTPKDIRKSTKEKEMFRLQCLEVQRFSLRYRKAVAPPAPLPSSAPPSRVNALKNSKNRTRERVTTASGVEGKAIGQVANFNHNNPNRSIIFGDSSFHAAAPPCPLPTRRYGSARVIPPAVSSVQRGKVAVARTMAEKAAVALKNSSAEKATYAWMMSNAKDDPTALDEDHAGYESPLIYLGDDLSDSSPPDTTGGDDEKAGRQRPGGDDGCEEQHRLLEGSDDERDTFREVPHFSGMIVADPLCE